MPRETFEIYAPVVASKYLRGILAQRHGVKDETVQRWGSPVESDRYPTGTGKANTLDRLLRDMRIIYPMFPIEAREMAEVVAAEINRLDMADGASSADSDKPCAAVMKSIRESLDVLEKIEEGKLSPDTIAELEKEWREMEAGFYRAKGCVEALIAKHKRI